MTVVFKLDLPTLSAVSWPMPLRKSQAAHIGRLARLKLTTEETDKFSSELAVIVDYFDQIKGVPTGTSGVEEAGKKLLREDSVEPSLSVEKALGNVPNHDGGFILVPKVLQG